MKEEIFFFIFCFCLALSQIGILHRKVWLLVESQLPQGLPVKPNEEDLVHAFVCFRVLSWHFSIRRHFVSVRQLFFCRDCNWLQQLHTTHHRVRPVLRFLHTHGARVRCGATQTCTWGDSTKTCCSSLTT